MPTIQVTTDVMRQLGQVFVHLNEQLDHEMTPQMQNYIGQLEGDWQGVSRKRFGHHAECCVQVSSNQASTDTKLIPPL
jgi:uncharacterized protein YukE